MPDDDLLAFLTARLDETEATARDAGSRSAHAELYVMDDDCHYPLGIGRDAVLADIEAKRALIEDVFAYEANIDGEWGCCHTSAQIRAGECPRTAFDEITALRILASCYRHHPGWRAEWAPETRL